MEVAIVLPEWGPEVNLSRYLVCLSVDGLPKKQSGLQRGWFHDVGGQR